MTLYHFTDSRNIPSIRRYGLLSWKRLVEKNINHWPASSENSRWLDSRSNLQDYIRLCKQPSHPMAHKAIQEGRIQDFVWLEIDDVVTNWRATLYSSDNAVAHRAIINNDPRTAFDSNSIQAEILVLGGLNQKWIKFPDIQTRKYATTLPRESGFDIPF